MYMNTFINLQGIHRQIYRITNMFEPILNRHSNTFISLQGIHRQIGPLIGPLMNVTNISI